MERLKNVYKVTVKCENGNEIELKVFSHSLENAVKKATSHCQKQLIKVLSVEKTELIFENVIY